MIAAGIAAFVLGLAAGLATWFYRSRPMPAALAPIDPADRFCCDCRWMRRGSRHDLLGPGQSKCAHPTGMRMRGEYLATGKRDTSNMHYCAVMRDVRSDSGCGPAGQHWERAA